MTNPKKTNKDIEEVLSEHEDVPEEGSLSDQERDRIISASKALYNLPSTQEVLEDIEKQEIPPVSPLHKIPQQQIVQDFSVAPIEGNNAMRMHFETKEIVGTIAENTCIRDGRACIYAPHLSKYNKRKQITEEQCDFKNYLDNQIYEMLQSGLILTIQIAHCDHYSAEGDMGKIAERIIVQ